MNKFVGNILKVPFPDKQVPQEVKLSPSALFCSSHLPQSSFLTEQGPVSFVFTSLCFCGIPSTSSLPVEILVIFHDPETISPLGHML